MLAMTLLKLALLVIVVFLVTRVDSQFRILGGAEMEQNKVPFQVFIRMVTSSERSRCGGSIYDKVNVVTAAHCCYGNMTVHGGVHNVTKFDSKVQSIAVEEMIIHENYNGSSHTNDVCILHLQHPFIYNKYVQPAKFPQQNETIKPYELSFATGWGRVISQKQSSDVLMGVYVPVLPNEVCTKAYENHTTKFDPITMVCAGTGEGKGTCKGDSGGPLTVHGVVIGITSWSHKVKGECSTLPDNYARVARYINWFEKNKKIDPDAIDITS